PGKGNSRDSRLVFTRPQEHKLAGDTSAPIARTKAAVVTRFGSRWSMEIRQLRKPAANEVLVRVHAATVNRTDCGELRHPLFERLVVARGLDPRAVLGLDFAGEIESTGAGVSAYKPGDRVFGMCPRGGNGAQAEYLCMPETGAIAAMP